MMHRSAHVVHSPYLDSRLAVRDIKREGASELGLKEHACSKNMPGLYVKVAPAASICCRNTWPVCSGNDIVYSKAAPCEEQLPLAVAPLRQRRKDDCVHGRNTPLTCIPIGLPAPTHH